MAKQVITESEYEIMQILWNAPKPLSLGEILKSLTENNWSRNTVGTLLSRLCEKGVVAYNQTGKVYFYYAVLKEHDYSLSKTKSFLDKLYQGSIGNLVACLYENQAISEEELKQLREIINQEPHV